MLGVLDTLFSALVGVAKSVLGLLPTFDVAEAMGDMPEGLASLLGVVNYFIPLGAITSILLVWAGVMLAVNVYFIVSSKADKSR